MEVKMGVSLAEQILLAILLVRTKHISHQYN